MQKMPGKRSLKNETKKKTNFLLLTELLDSNKEIKRLDMEIIA